MAMGHVNAAQRPGISACRIALLNVQGHLPQLPGQRASRAPNPASSRDRRDLAPLEHDAGVRSDRQLWWRAQADGIWSARGAVRSVLQQGLFAIIPRISDSLDVELWIGALQTSAASSSRLAPSVRIAQIAGRRGRKVGCGGTQKATQVICNYLSLSRFALRNIARYRLFRLRVISQ